MDFFPSILYFQTHLNMFITTGCKVYDWITEMLTDQGDNKELITVVIML